MAIFCRKADRLVRLVKVGSHRGTKRAGDIGRRNVFALDECLHVLVATTEGRAVEVIAKLFEANVHVFLDRLPTLR